MIQRQGSPASSPQFGSASDRVFAPPWGLFVQLVISEIDSSAATSLQAVKLLALYLTGDKVSALDLTSIASDLFLIVILLVWIWVVEMEIVVIVGLDL